MDKQVLLYSCFLLVGVFISSISQVMLKKSALKQYDSKIREYLNPLVIFAYVLFFGSTILSILSYQVVDISFGPILEATGYIYVTVFGIVLFKEKLNAKKVFALVLILGGIASYALLDIPLF